MLLLPRTLEALLGIQETMDRTLDNGFSDYETTGRCDYPPVNIFEKNGDLVLVAELPGVKKEDLKVEVKGDTIRLAGEQTVDYGKDSSPHRIERGCSKFDRTLKLPVKVEPDKVKAEYKDGLLVISLVRAESDKPKQITIQ
jgi:HSP20 family protein